MITTSTELAIRSLIYIGITNTRGIISPKVIAERLGSSPTYLSKLLGRLVEADILHSRPGPNGGVSYNKRPREITLLMIAHATQEMPGEKYCKTKVNSRSLGCSFHKAMFDIHNAMIKTLKSWTIADLLKKPGPCDSFTSNKVCKLFFKDVIKAKTAKKKKTKGWK